MWITEDEAVKLSGRSKYTLRKWRHQKLVPAKKYKQQWMFDDEALLRARQLMELRYQERLIVAGPGRGKRKPFNMLPLFEDDGL